MTESPLPLIGFAAWSGTGKTTLITALIPLLAARGLRVAVLKHAHHSVEFDRPGKDSHRLRCAGAERVLVASARRWAMFAERREAREPELAAELARLDPRDLDLVLVEGFKGADMAKIELHRPSLGRPLLYPQDARMAAVACDAPLPDDAPPPPALLDLNDPAAIADFIAALIDGDNNGHNNGDGARAGDAAAAAASCMSDFDPDSLSVEAARSRVLQQVTRRTAVERIAVGEALDRVLAEVQHAPIDVPPHCCSAMDGYALCSADLPAAGDESGDEIELRVVGKSLAGHPYAGELQPGQAVRITTGAVVPAGAGLVAMQENVRRDGDRLYVGGGERTGQHLRAAGSDIPRGAQVLTAGRRLGPAELGLLASLGIAEVAVRRRPVVAFFSTGDELAPLGEPLTPGQIHDSNRYTLRGMLLRCGAEPLDLGAVADDRAALAATLEAAAARADAVVTSGGVSVGEADYIRELLEAQGELSFWKIAMKPGRPLTLGRLPGADGDVPFFGLPGNPVSVMATFYQFVRPALLAMAGEDWQPPLSIRARARQALKKAPGRIEYQRGVLARDADGEWAVDSTGLQDSHVLSSMSRANCFVVLPLASAGCAAGDWVDVEPFAGLV